MHVPGSRAVEEGSPREEWVWGSARTVSSVAGRSFR